MTVTTLTLKNHAGWWRFSLLRAKRLRIAIF